MNLFTKSVATESGILFAGAFYAIFTVSEARNQRKHAATAKQMKEHFQLEHPETIGREALEIRPGGILVTMRDAANPFALKWALSRTNTDDQDIVVLTARMMGAGGPEYIDASEQLFSEHEQMLFHQGCFGSRELRQAYLTARRPGRRYLRRSCADSQLA